MLVRCPTCASAYDLDPRLLSEGRVLRCAHCRDAWVHSWGAVVAPEPAPAPARPEITAEARSARWPVTFEPRPAPARRPPPRAARRRLAPALGALAAAAALISGMAAVAAKERVVAAFPPSAALYAAIGLPVNLRGLALDVVRSVVEQEAGAATLRLEGRVANLRATATPVPALRVAIHDAGGRELYFWTAPAPKARLAAGEAAPFDLRLSAPPREGQTLAVTFAPPAAAPRHVADAGG